MPDPVKGSAQDLSLRREFTAQERRRQMMYAEWDRQLAAGARKLEATRLSTTVENLRRQTADALAELHELDDEEAATPAGIPDVTSPEVFPSAEEAVAASGPWSPEFAAWRAEHIPSSRGIIQ